MHLIPQNEKHVYYIYIFISIYLLYVYIYICRNIVQLGYVSFSRIL